MRRVCMLLLPPAALVGGYWLRMQQTVLAADTAPAFFKNRWGVCLWAMLGGLFLLLMLLGLGEDRDTDLRTSCHAVVGLPFQWAGALLICFAAASAAMVFWPEWRTLGFYVNAATALAVFLLLPVLMLRFRRSEAGVGLLLLPPLLLVLYRLLRYYLSFASDPAIHTQEMRLIFFAAFTLFLLSLAALAFGDRCRRRLLLFAGLATGAAGAAMVDTAAFNDALLIVGCTGLAFGFYLSALFAEAGGPARAAYELVQHDPFAGKPVAPGPETPKAEMPAEDDPFPVIFDENGVKMPPPQAAAVPAGEKKTDGGPDLSRVDRLLREME